MRYVKLAARSHQLEQAVAGDVAVVVDRHRQLLQARDEACVHRRGVEQRLAERAPVGELGGVAALKTRSDASRE